MEFKPITFTAPKAYIKIGNAVAGYLRNLSWTENISRGTVRGIGTMVSQEAPALSIDCQFQVDQFFIDLNRPELKSMINRFASVEAFVNSLSLGETAFSIVVYAKTISEQDSVSKLVTGVDLTGKTIVNLAPCFVNSQSFQLSEGQISGFNTSGIYLNPVTTLNY